MSEVAVTLEPSILLVEDEESLATMLRYNFEREGFRVATAFDGDEALMAVKENPPDIIVLDWMLPHLSGIEVCRQLRRDKATRSTPVIMLTARGEERDKLQGFETGADDYVVKPFSPAELVARVRAVLKRSRPGLSTDHLTCGSITLDQVTHKISRNGRDITMGPTEYRLLLHLMEHPSRVFSREQILDAVWGRDIYVEARTVDVHIRRLRVALNAPGEPDPIRTVRAVGYAIEPVS